MQVASRNSAAATSRLGAEGAPAILPPGVRAPGPTGESGSALGPLTGHDPSWARFPSAGSALEPHGRSGHARAPSQPSTTGDAPFRARVERRRAEPEMFIKLGSAHSVAEQDPARTIQEPGG